MADEAAPIPANANKNEKTFTLKAIIVFVLVLMVWTIALFYFLKGNSGKADHEENLSNSENQKLFSRLVLEQNEIPPIRITDMIVQIKLDKNGDTSKLLICGFAFHLGLTQKEQKAIDENKWPPLTENTRFNLDNLTEKEYKSELFSLKHEIEKGKVAEGGGHGSSSKGPAPGSYLSLMTNLSDELKAKILEILMQTTYSQINTEDGKIQICEQLKNEANAMLKNLGKYPRVYKVSFISFNFQP